MLTVPEKRALKKADTDGYKFILLQKDNRFAGKCDSVEQVRDFPFVELMKVFKRVEKEFVRFEPFN